VAILLLFRFNRLSKKAIAPIPRTVPAKPA